MQSEKIFNVFIFIACFILLLIIGSLAVFFYKDINPKVPKHIIETYQKEATVISFDPPKHVYINLKFSDDIVKKYYISKHCFGNKIQKAIDNKTKYTLTFDVFELTNYDGEVKKSTHMRENLYTMFCS